MLDIREIVTSYGMIRALKGVSLTAAPGEITCILGPNGAGKTTLLYTIAGILRPRSGSITFEGRELAGLSADRVVARGISLVPENRLVFPHMTVRENLIAGAYGRLPRGAARWTQISRACSPASPSSGSAPSSRPGRCPAASSRCWRWRGRSWRVPGSS